MLEEHKELVKKMLCQIYGEGYDDFYMVKTRRDGYNYTFIYEAPFWNMHVGYLSEDGFSKNNENPYRAEYNPETFPDELYEAITIETSSLCGDIVAQILKEINGKLKQSSDAQNSANKIAQSLYRDKRVKV